MGANVAGAKFPYWNSCLKRARRNLPRKLRRERKALRTRSFVVAEVKPRPTRDTEAPSP